MTTNTLVASAARTATGTSGAIGLGNMATVNVEVETTAVSGTSPSMALTALWSDDGVNFGANDGSADTFTAITAVGNVVKNLTVRAPYVQFQWTLTGTSPSFTFSIVQSGLYI